MKKIVIIKTGRTFPEIRASHGDFEDWIKKGIDAAGEAAAVFDALEAPPPPRPEAYGGVIITGSHAMVTDEANFSLRLEKWIPGLIEKKIPLLGICFGHQLLAKAMGGKVAARPGGLELGAREIRLLQPAAADRLFKGFPRTIRVHVSRSQTVTRLPEGACALAQSGPDPHHAFRIGPCAWGVQFHPEYDETVMRAYIGHYSKTGGPPSAGQEQEAMETAPTPFSARILSRFSALAFKGEKQETCPPDETGRGERR